MSRSPFDRSPDLRRLIDDGFDAVVEGGSLVVRDVAYVDSGRRVRRGTLEVPLELAGDASVPPTRHVSWFVGERPYGADGRPMALFDRQDAGGRIFCEDSPRWEICLKPDGREFRNFHEFVTAHAGALEAEAEALAPGSSSRRVVEETGGGWSGPFEYADTSSARYGIASYASGIARSRIGIVGLGGTGSYVLDLVAKTPVAAIRLFDDDVFEQHNAFRAPGAAEVGEFGEKVSKVHRFAEIYSRMHSGVIPHPVRLGPGNARLLADLDFVFLCMDDSVAKAPILAELRRRGTPFVDCGIGLFETVDGLAGMVRVTTSSDGSSESLLTEGLIPSSGGDADDPYAFRAQVAELNALNASLAVIRWKRLAGFYADAGGECHSLYCVDANQSINLSDRRVGAYVGSPGWPVADGLDRGAPIGRD